MTAQQKREARRMGLGEGPQLHPNQNRLPPKHKHPQPTKSDQLPKSLKLVKLTWKEAWLAGSLTQEGSGVLASHVCAEEEWVHRMTSRNVSIIACFSMCFFPSFFLDMFLSWLVFRSVSVIAYFSKCFHHSCLQQVTQNQFRGLPVLLSKRSHDNSKP